jgi:2-oxoglutarate ferredoxin oxidoreductase subunit gamma
LTSLLIAGSGGQGILFVGKLIAQAAMLSGRNVTWFPSYGAEVRGGTANCTVVISEGLIGSPVVRNPDIIIVMNEASLERFEGRVKKGGLLLSDSSMVRKRPARDDILFLEVPAGELALSLGAPLSANMVIAGALARKAAVCGIETLRKALEELTPKGRAKSLAANIEAIEKGWDYVGP